MRDENIKRLAYWIKVCFGLGGLIVLMVIVDALLAQGADTAKGQTFFLLITAFCILVLGFNLRHILKEETRVDEKHKD